MTDSERLLRLKEVLRLIPVSRATWYAGIKSGRFPKSISLGLALWRGARAIYARLSRWGW